MPEKIYIYNENCVMAGKQVPQKRLDDSSDPDGCWDWTAYELTEEEAAFMEARGGFGQKVAKTIRGAIE